MSGSATLTNTKKIGDVVRAIFHPGYCYESGVFENHLVGAIDLPSVLGMAVKKVGTKWRSVQAGDEANTGGLLLSQAPLALAGSATSTDKFAILVNGPALVDKSAFLTTDSAGATIDVDDVMTALSALDPKIKEVVEPTLTSTQTS